jgi:hypothetical protein
VQNLITTLKEQHLAVQSLAGKINDALARKDVSEIRRHLLTLQNAVVAHLQLEDDELYPELIRTARSENLPQVADIAASFASAMRHISTAVVKFFQTYTAPAWSIASFERAWPGILEELSLRIAAEESQLYPMYEKHVLRAQKQYKRYGS